VISLVCAAFCGVALAAEASSRDRVEGTNIFVVNANRKIEERIVSLGLETPRKLEVLSGLSESELVMIGNRTQFKPGQLVEPKPIEEVKLAEQ